MMNNNFFGATNVKNVVNNMRRGERGVNIVAVVSCDKQLAPCHKDMAGRIIKVVMWTDRPLVSYSGNVNAKADEKFTPQERKGFTWTQYPYFETANKSGVEYLTFSYRNCDKGECKEIYLIDGVLTAKDVAKAYFKEKKKTAPQTQIAVGVTKTEEFSRVVRYELDKIVYIGSEKEKATELFEQFKE